MDPLLKQVGQTIKDHGMLEETRTLLVAVSGGPDSMALLHALYRLRDSFPVQLIVAHLNHRMRADAATDAQFVAARAQELALPYVSTAIDVPAYRRRHKLSPEDAARRVRYDFLQATAAEHQAQRIALGHTADDQAETVLLRMLRGTGLKGLAGIPPVRGSIVRPLIRVHRQEVLTFLRAHGIPFREDPTNQQREYRRNQVRLDLLPLLQQRYNPRIVEALCSLADLLAADDAALRLAAQQALQVARVQGSPAHVELQIDALTTLPPALQGRVLREALGEAAGGLQGFTRKHILAILKLLQGEDGQKWLVLPRGMIVERRYSVLQIHRGFPPASLPVDVPLPIPGRRSIATLGITLRSEIRTRETLPGPFPTGDQVWLDAARLQGEVRVRTRRAGDRFQPLGSPYAKKLKRFLIDAKIPHSLRDRLPLIVSPAGIAWVGGVQLAEWARVTPSTREILRLSLIRHPPGAALPAGDSGPGT